MNRNTIIVFLIIIILLVIYFGYTSKKQIIKIKKTEVIKPEIIKPEIIKPEIIKPENSIIKKTNKIVKIRNQCAASQSDTLINVINENFKNFNHNLYIPCSYDNIEFEYNLMECDQAGMYFIIDNSDIMVAKDFLAMSLYSYYGDDANKYIPKTWIPYNTTSIEQFKNQYDPTKLYILKKNIQQQKDIKIYNNEFNIINTINKNKNEHFPYVVIQELLQNPYLIDDRKINLRVYILLVKYNNEYRIYMYNDGFMYYTASKYESNSLDLKVNITTGYIDREVYEKNPLTIKDFQKYLDDESRPLTPIEKKIQRYNMLSEYLMTNILDLVKKVFRIFDNKLGNKEKLKNNLKFQIYGIDVAVDEKLQVKIMEINKGPDLNSKDDRDCAIKYNLIKDAFKTVDILDNDKNDKNNNFIRVYYD